MKYFKKLVGETIYLSPRNSEDVEIFTKWLNDFQVTDGLGRSGLMVTLDGEKEYFEKVDKSQNIINDENIIKIVELFHTKEDKEAISYNASVEEIAANGFNLCTTQYVTRNIKDTIIIEDNKKYLKKYDDLVKRLAQIDKQLENLRSRLMKGQ